MRREPVVIGGIVSIIVSLGAIFGLELSNEDVATTVAVVVAIVTFIQRSLVSPVTPKGQ